MTNQDHAKKVLRLAKKAIKLKLQLSDTRKAVHDELSSLGCSYEFSKTMKKLEDLNYFDSMRDQ